MKKIYILLLVFLVSGLLSVGIARRFAFADDKNGQNDNSTLSNNSGENESEGSNSNASKANKENDNNGGVQAGLTISESDKVELNGGKVVSVSGQSLSVGVFGLSLSISVSSQTAFVGAADISHVSAGDTISIHGTIDPVSGIITASRVQDETQRQGTIASIQKQIQVLLDQLHQLEAQINSQSQK